MFSREVFYRENSSMTLSKRDEHLPQTGSQSFARITQILLHFCLRQVEILLTRSVWPNRVLHRGVITACDALRTATDAKRYSSRPSSPGHALHLFGTAALCSG